MGPWLLAGAGYLALILLFTWPLAIRLGSVLPHDLGDPMFGTYLLWWNAHAVPLTERWWNAPFLWPVKGAYGLSEHLLGLSVIGTPLQWLGASPVTAYNVIFILSFPAAALAAHALVFRLTGRHDAATIAGLIFGFSPYRNAQLAHIQMLWTFWMPVALLALHEYAADGRARWLVLFGAMWLGQALSNGYFIFFFPVLIAGWLTWFFLLRGDVRRFFTVVGAAAVAALPLVPILFGYAGIQRRMSLQREFGEISELGADVVGFFTTAPSQWAWTRLATGHGAEEELFTGLTPVVLIAAASAVALMRIRRTPRPFPALQIAFGAVMCLGLVFSVIPMFAGPWRVAIGGTTLVSVTTPTKPLTVAIWAAIGMALTGRTFARAISTRSLFAFYALATIAMYVLGWGPTPAFNTFPFWYKGPYTLLMQLPGYSAVRVPARFAALGTLCLAVTAGLALVRLTGTMARRTAAAIGAACCAAALVDCWMFNIDLPRVPPRIQALEGQNRADAVLELPTGDGVRDLSAMYRSIYHGMPVVNGYAGYAPAPTSILRLSLDEGDISALDAIDGSLVMVVDPNSDDRQWKAFGARLDAAVVDAATGRKIFTIPKPPADTGPPAGAPLPIRSATASAEVDLAALTDGDPISHWDSMTPQRGHEWIAFDLGSKRQVDGLMLAVGPAFGGYARSIAIDVSIDGEQWATVLEGRGSARAVRAADQNPYLGPVTYTFPPAEARWIRARQLGYADPFTWSICEAAVFGR